jgi:hypothetical protein
MAVPDAFSWKIWPMLLGSDGNPRPGGLFYNYPTVAGKESCLGTDIPQTRSGHFRR